MKLSLCILLAILSASSVARAADDPQTFQRMWQAFVDLGNEPLWVTGDVACEFETQDYATSLTPQAVCASEAISDRLTWAYGWGHAKQAACGQRVIQDYETKLTARADNRARIDADLHAGSPAARREMYRAFGDADQSWYGSEKYLAALDKYVETQKLFSNDERVLLWAYFQTGYARINPVLRQGGEGAHCLKPLIDEMNAAFRKLQHYDGWVWRGLNLTDAEAQTYPPGAEIDWPAYSSTTTDRSVAEGFAHGTQDGKKPVIFKIRSHGCIDVSGASDKLQESEVLCLPGTRVRVVAKQAPNLVELEEIPPTH